MSEKIRFNQGGQWELLTKSEERFNVIKKSDDEYEIEDLEKAERRIVRTTPNPTSQQPRRVVGHDDVKFHTNTKATKFRSRGTAENPKDEATYSEHVVIHHNKPVGIAQVHHEKDAPHHVKIVGDVPEHLHQAIKAGVTKHISGDDFKEHVKDHNATHYSGKAS